MRNFRILIAIVSVLVMAPAAFGAAAISPAFGVFSSASGGKISAAQQGTNTLNVVGGTVAKINGKPTLAVGALVDVRQYADAQHPNGNLTAAVADIQAHPEKGGLRLFGAQYVVESTIIISTLDFVIEGQSGDRLGATGAGYTRGSQILYTGTGPCFQIGTDNSTPWDGNYHEGRTVTANGTTSVTLSGSNTELSVGQWLVLNGQKAQIVSIVGTTMTMTAIIPTGSGIPISYASYDGVMGFRLSHLSIKHNNPDTLLANGQGSYKAGSYGIRDWRGGSIRLTDVQIENFDYNFWGVQSDINKFWDVTSLYSKHGIYAGPRSDQFDIYGLYTFFCDTALEVDGALVRLHSPQFVGCGSSTTYPIVVMNGSRSLDIDGHPWFEKLQGYAGEVKAFLQAGVVNGYGNNSTAVPSVTVHDPCILTNVQGASAGYSKYFAEVGSAFVTIGNPVGVYSQNLAKLVSFVNNQNGTTYTNASSSARLTSSSIYDWSSKLYDNNGGGTPGFNAGDKVFEAFRVKSTNGRVYVGRLPADNDRDFYLSSEYDKTFNAVFPDSGDNNNRIQIRSRFWTGTQSKSWVPTGSWDQGDFYTFQDAGSTDAMGSRCTSPGTAGTYTEGLTATTDGGPSVTLSGATSVLLPGMWLVINAQPAKVLSKAGNVLTMDTGIPAGSGLAISYLSPSFTPFGGQDFTTVKASSSLQAPTITSSGDDVSVGVQNRNFTAAAAALTMSSGTASNSSGTYVAARVTPVLNQTGTAASTVFQVNQTETGLGSGTHRLVDFLAAGVSKFSVDRLGFVSNAIGGAVSSATTITPTGPIFHVTGTTAVATINLPYSGFLGCMTIIPDGTFTTTTAGNIALASSAVVNKLLTMCYDGTKWYPSY